jgi:hypothetical protein
LSTLRPSGGGDLPESTLEALFQATTGIGFDQDCDGGYDANTDVPPFISSPDDLFSGTANGVYDARDASSGVIGGVGIRRYALPIFVYTTDAAFRDVENGYPVAGSCSNGATRSDVLDAVLAVGGKLIGVNAGDDEDVTNDMTELAQATYSMVDLDGDGLSEPLVLSSKGGPEIVDAVVKGVNAFQSSGEFQKVELKIDSDDWGFVQKIDPPFYTQIQPGDNLDFTLTLFGASPAGPDDQFYVLNLVVLGDGATSLDSQQILIVVPGA